MLTRFFCRKCPDYRLVYKRDQRGYELDAEGRQMVITLPEEYIQFKNHYFETEDEKKINFLRAHGCFTGRGETKMIIELPPPDQNAMKIQEFMRQLGSQQVAEILESTMKQRGPSPGVVTTDPVAATMMYQQQMAAQQQQRVMQAQPAQQQNYIPQPYLPQNPQQQQIQNMQAQVIPLHQHPQAAQAR